jgi:tryptophan 7-halogenase
MGFRPEPPPSIRRLDDPLAAARCMQVVEQLKHKYLAGLESNRDLIEHVRARGLPRV